MAIVRPFSHLEQRDPEVEAQMFRDYDSVQKAVQRSYVLYDKVEKLRKEVDHHRKILEELFGESLLEKPEDAISTITEMEFEVGSVVGETTSQHQLRRQLRLVRLRLEEAGRRLVAQQQELERRAETRRQQGQCEANMTQCQQRLAELHAKIELCREQLQRDTRTADLTDTAGQRRDNLRRILRQRAKAELAHLEDEYRRTEKQVELHKKRQAKKAEESQEDKRKKGDLQLKDGLLRWALARCDQFQKKPPSMHPERCSDSVDGDRQGQELQEFICSAQTLLKELPKLRVGNLEQRNESGAGSRVSRSRQSDIQVPEALQRQLHCPALLSRLLDCEKDARSRRTPPQRLAGDSL